MADYKYAFENYDAQKMAKAVGRDVSVSTKQAIEICSAIRGKNLAKSKELLEDVMAKKRPIKFNRFTNGIGHRRGPYSSGAYPLKAAKAFLEILLTVESNAQNKGLNTADLAIIHACAHKAATPMHQGTKRRSEFKKSHIEIVVMERKPKKAVKKLSSKVEDKKSVPSEEVTKSVKKPAESADTKKQGKPLQEEKTQTKKSNSPETKEDKK